MEYLALLAALYFILPAYFANMAPVIAAKLRLPLGKAINEKAFGAHKTYRGFYAGYAGAFLALLLQQWLQSAQIAETIRLLDYGHINIWLYAFLFGVGAITGDLVKSYLKRRLGKKPGSAWFPFDQIDFILGALVFVSILYTPSLLYLLIILLATPVLHFIVNVTAYFLRLKEVWW